MQRRSTLTISCPVLVLVLLVALSLGCNRVETNAGADASSTRDAGASAGGPPVGSDLTSLGPGAETRIYYQYVDTRGSVRFAERLDDVPTTWRDRVGYLELDSPPPMSPADAKRTRDARYAAANPSAAARAGSSGQAGRAMDRFEPEVILYYADWCGYCKKAKRHLDRQGVAYELRDVDNPHIKQELLDKTGQKGIPVIEVDGRIMKGYNARRLDELLDAI